MPLLPKHKRKKASSGQTLIEILVAVSLFAILGHALFSLVATSFTIVNFTRARVAARHLAQEKIELLRNLPYDDVGTIGGIPSGPIEQTENIQRNGLNYTVKTGIVYIDDPFDNLAPNDLLPTDYKRVRVDVSWKGLASSSRNPVTIVSDIAPRGVESTDGGGTLSILVFNGNAEPVPQANVSIVATETSPQVNLDLQTGDNGRIILPGAPECTNCYQITVTKDNYSSERTYSTSEVANPDKPHQSVIEGYLTEISFAIDEVSTIDLLTLTENAGQYIPSPNTEISIRGDKILGTDASDMPVYKYTETLTTNASGNLLVENLEWDNYYVSLPSDSPWTISGSTPPIPFQLLPSSTQDVEILFSPITNNSLLLTFVDTAENPIASVAARLTNLFGYEATASSGIQGDPNFGQVFFGDLQAVTHNLVATVSGFLDFDGDISVDGNNLEEIIMTSE